MALISWAQAFFLLLEFFGILRVILIGFLVKEGSNICHNLEIMKTRTSYKLFSKIIKTFSEKLPKFSVKTEFFLFNCLLGKVTVYEQSLKRPFSLKVGNRLFDRNLLFVDVNILVIVAKYDMRNLRLLGGNLRLFGLQ